MFFLLTNGGKANIINDVDAGLAHLVERHLAKVEVASSSLVTRSRKRCTTDVQRSIRRHSQEVRQRSAKPLFTSSNLVGASIKKVTQMGGLFIVYRKPLARRVVPKKTYVDDEIKTPFAIIGVRSGNCTNKQREVIQKRTT